MDNAQLTPAQIQVIKTAIFDALDKIDDDEIQDILERDEVLRILDTKIVDLIPLEELINTSADFRI